MVSNSDNFELIKEKIQNIKDDISEFKADIREIKEALKSDFVTRGEFTLVRNVVFGFVGLILLAFATYWVSLAVQQPK